MSGLSGRIRISGVLLSFLILSIYAHSASRPEKVIIDTDIGDDVDDAFAVALALRSPEVQVLGITFGLSRSCTLPSSRISFLRRTPQNLPVPRFVPTRQFRECQFHRFGLWVAV